LSDIKVPIGKLFERRSKSTGRCYLAGRLGDARVLIFRESNIPKEALAGADAMWTIFVAVGDQGFAEREERRQRAPLAATGSFRREGK
jgi:hypothetical protein